MRSNRNQVCNTQFGQIIVNRNDLYIGASIIRGGYYELEEIKSLVELIRKTNRHSRPQLLDIGANIGTHMLAYSEIEGSEVHCFEAQRAVFNMLAGTVALNGIDNVYLYNRAVSDRSNEEIEFDRPDYDSQINIGGFELLPPHHSDGGTRRPTNQKEKVSTLRIDDLGLDRVAYIKMDIEGMEASCLRGAKETITRCRPVLVMETFKSNFNELSGILTDLGYSWENKGVDVHCFPAEF